MVIHDYIRYIYIYISLDTAQYSIGSTVTYTDAYVCHVADHRSWVLNEANVQHESNVN